MTNLPKPRPLQRQDALFLDFDGTLAAIAQRPDDVVIAPGLPDLLVRTRDALGGALALISGRTISAIDRLTDGAVSAVAGIHGMERRRADGIMNLYKPAPTSRLLQVRAALTELAEKWPGVLIEDKGPAFALHYRLEPQAEDWLTEAARAAVADSGGTLALIEGDRVLEIMARGADKGTALRAFLAEPPFLARPPVFIGDDVTDEAAFAEVERYNGLTVIVGTRRPTVARTMLQTVAAVHGWIGTLTQELGATVS